MPALRRGGGPRLAAAEWAALIDLHLRHGGAAGAALDRDLAELSARLAEFAAQRGSPRQGTQLRSPAGLKRRLTVLRALERGEATRVPAEASAAWSRYAHDRMARTEFLSAYLDGASVQPAMASPSANPRWTRDETILALVAYLGVRPSYASRDHSAVRELSQLLQARSSHGVGKRATSYRNPDGVARKLNKFRAAEEGVSPNSVRGAALEHEIWRAFLERPATILAEAVQIQRQLDEAHGISASAPAPSRGPAPWAGTFAGRRDATGPHDLYLMMLSVDDCAPRWFKLGYSNDLSRRLGELNFGLPPGSGMRWTLIGHRRFASAQRAYEVEQRMLAELHAAGRCVGGEFVEIELGSALTLLPQSVTS